MSDRPSRRTTRRRSAGRRPPAGPSGPDRRERNRRETTERIVASALALFQARGFEATTTRAIAKKAGIAEGTIFNYFPTKDDIALHFFEMEVDRAIEAVRGYRRLAKAPLEEKLFVLVQSQFDYLEPYQRFIGSALVEALKPQSRLGFFSHRAHALRHRYIAFVEELFETSLPRKRFSPIRAWAPDAFWLFYLGALLFWLNDDSPRKQKTLAFLDRALKVGVSILSRAT